MKFFHKRGVPKLGEGVLFFCGGVPYLWHRRVRHIIPGTFGRLDPYGGKYDIVRAISNVPDTQGEAGPLLGNIWHFLGNVICPRHTRGGWTPIGGHLILSGQYHLSRHTWEARPLLWDIWYCPGNVICPRISRVDIQTNISRGIKPDNMADTLWTLDPQ